MRRGWPLELEPRGQAAVQPLVQPFPAARQDALPTAPVSAVVPCLPLVAHVPTAPRISGLALGAASLALSAALYAALWGWQLSLGLVVGIYTHELGHMLALRRLGLPTSAPIFVPFVGAAVKAPRQPVAPRDALRVALAGPAAGLACALGFGLLHALLHAPTMGWLALGLVGLNLCDLLPVPPLDGSRALSAWRAMQTEAAR